MKKCIYMLAAGSLLLTMLFSASCRSEKEVPERTAEVRTTRAYGDKTPKIVTTIEVNDTNPLNTMLYRMNNELFFDITTLFAANIRANGTEPALWLNDNVTEILIPDAGSTTTGHYKYVQPIRQDGGKVLLTILGDHQGVGVANLSIANQQKFAEILAWAVEEYQLDGIDFDDEWSKYGDNPNFPSSVTGSFNGLVAKLRAELDARFPNEHKLITALYCNDAVNLSSAAVADMDFAWAMGTGPNYYASASSPWTNAKWSALSINVCAQPSPLQLIQMKKRVIQSVNDGMGAIATYGLGNQCDPLPVLNKIAEGAFNSTVTRNSSPASGYTKDWTATAGTLITYSDITNP